MENAMKSAYVCLWGRKWDTFVHQLDSQVPLPNAALREKTGYYIFTLNPHTKSSIKKDSSWMNETVNHSIRKLTLFWKCLEKAKYASQHLLSSLFTQCTWSSLSVHKWEHKNNFWAFRRLDVLFIIKHLGPLCFKFRARPFPICYLSSVWYGCIAWFVVQTWCVLPPNYSLIFDHSAGELLLIHERTSKHIIDYITFKYHTEAQVIHISSQRI